MSRGRLSVAGRTVYVGPASSASANERCVVFIHGAGMDHTVWALPIRHFARKGWRVLAVDLPGHGRTEGPPLDSIVGMANWLATVLDAAEAEAAAVAGHSMGSLVAWEFARRHGARCSALALLGTSAPMPVTDQLLDAASDDHHAAIDMANAWSHSPRGRIGGNAAPGVWMLGAGERLLERAGPGVLHADLAACNGYSAGDGGVDCPVLVVVGEADQMTPAKAALGVAAKANARIARLPGCGHAMLSERPNDVLDALLTAFP